MGIDKPRWINLGPQVREIRKQDGKLTVITDTNHGLGSDNLLRLSGLSSPQFDGVYRVSNVISSTVLECLAPQGQASTTRPATAPVNDSPATTAPTTAPAADDTPAGELFKISSGRVHRVGFWPRVGELTNSQFFDLLLFRFPKSMRYEESVWTLIGLKGPISLAIQLPAFLITLALQLLIALYVAAFRGKALDFSITILTVLTLSIPTISLYLLFQWILAAKLAIFPVAGWKTGVYMWQFAALPILAMIFVSVGGGARFYRTVALEEINAEYVRTARAKGALRGRVLLTHVLRNLMIPVVTNTVTALPFLIFGALILEQIFQIPGLGGLMVQAIFNQDRSIVMAITYITSITYCVALLINDILYTLVDPRVSLR